MNETTALTSETPPAGVAVLDQVAPEDAAEPDPIVDEMLVEEISIDGMCGVY
jgi:mycofactocin precursor